MLIYCKEGVEFDYHEKKYTWIWNIKLIKRETDVEKAKPELWGTFGRLAAPEWKGMEEQPLIYPPLW